jgi:hypothetical protein
MSEEHDKINNLHAGGRGKWNRDGKDGPSDLNNSMGILMRWLLTPGNLSLFRGPHGGKSKQKICGEIAEIINSHNVLIRRDAKGVKNKIDYIIGMFNKAHDFATNTGAGMKETDEGTFESAVKKICPYYFELLPIIGDRASARPMLTNEMLFDGGTEDVPLEVDATPDASGGEEEVAESDVSSVTSISNNKKRPSSSSSKQSSTRKDIAKRRNVKVDPVQALESMLVHHGERERERLDFEKKESEMRLKREEMLYKADLLMKFNELVKSGVEKETIFANMPEMRSLQTGCTSAQGGTNSSSTDEST